MAESVSLIRASGVAVPGANLEPAGEDVADGEAEAAARADLGMEGLEVDVAVLVRGDEEEAALLVLEQEVLGEGPG
jgi:hypothetical protein